jgi:hypothetical protein
VGLIETMIEACAGRPSLAAPLRSAQARLEGDALVLAVAADFAAFVKVHGDDYRELARAAAGRPLALRVDAQAAPGAASEAGSLDETTQRRQRLREEAAREPAVQEALDLFDGRLQDVREAKPSREDT